MTNVTDVLRLHATLPICSGHAPGCLNFGYNFSKNFRYTRHKSNSDSTYCYIWQTSRQPSYHRYPKQRHCFCLPYRPQKNSVAMEITSATINQSLVT